MLNPEAGLFGSTTRRQFVSRAGGTLMASSAASSLLAACGGNDENAEGEIGGDLRMLVWDGYQAPEASAPFRRKHDVSVKAELITGNTEIFTKLAAGGASQISLVTPYAGLAPLLAQADLIEPIDWNRIPNTKNLDPSAAEVSTKTFAVEGQTYTVPYQSGANVLIYNTEYLPEPPQSFMDFTKPEFTGKVGIWNSGADCINTWSRVLDLDPGDLSPTDLNKVIDFVIDLKQSQVRLFTDNGDALARALAAGDIVAIAGPAWSYFAELAREHGSKTTEWDVPEVGGIAWTDAWALPKGGPNQDTAYAWIDYMIGEAANLEVATSLAEVPVNRDAIKRAEDPSTKRILSPEVQERLRPGILPTGTNGTTSFEDWNSEWKRVEAA